MYPQVLRLAEGADEYIRTGFGNRIDPHVDFVEHLGASDPVAPHHRDTAGSALLSAGRAWDLLAIQARCGIAISFVLCDRVRAEQLGTSDWIDVSAHNAR
jgi:hypothetical protein